MVNMDNQIKQKGQMKGIGANPGLLIDSYEMKGKDGYIVYDDAFDTRAEIGFIGGEAVRADGPGKKIIETPWLSAGTIRDNMVMFLSYETSTVGEATSIVSQTPILEGKIYKRNPKTKEIEKSTEIGYRSKETSQKNPGTPQTQTHIDSFATRYLNFTPQHEYKIELTTSSQLENGQSIIIDYLYFEYIQNMSFLEPRSVAFSGYSADDLGGIPAIPQLEATEVAISLNANGDGSIRVTPYTEETYITTYNGYNHIFGTFNTVYGITYSPKGYSGSILWDTYAEASTVPSGGYDIIVDVNTGYGATTLYGYILVVGHKAVDQV